ncbi:TF211 [Hepatospora eriocheir]|uniref:TF211 n=1 Tax=Hepatospora eriocheir TaxID=1081669 RepID=A0A1X0QGX4_9MICR|nr:TF211 [Hepatospora eriocheir]
MLKLFKNINFKTPKIKKELQRLVGFINRFKDFIPNLSSRITCLTRMIRKNYIFKWSDKCRKSVEKIFYGLKKKSKLFYLDHTKLFGIFINESDTIIGGVLVQNSKLIGVFSRKLSSTQMN